MTARIGVVTFPGSLDDRDACRAVERAGRRRRSSSGTAMPACTRSMPSILPGGFSYGDYLRCGAIARFAPVMAEIIPAAARGLPVLGICNGFQILCEAHLLPGALTRNQAPPLHQPGRPDPDREQHLGLDQRIRRWPGAHGRAEERRGRLRRRRADAGRAGGARPGPGPLRRAATRTARSRDIAGVVSEAGNVAGLMPHPEHAIDVLTGPAPTVSASSPRSCRRSPVAMSTVGMSTVGCDRDAGHRGRRRGDAGPAAAVRRARADRRRVRPDRQHPRPPADRRRAGHLLGDVERALLLQVVPQAPAAVRATRRPPTDVLLAGIGQNAGVVDIGQGYAVTFKIESHNHPSYVEPFQGAATGVGGIVRDILAMGARPVAVMDALRFGPADAPDTHRVLPGVVGGISFYGNCLGLPNIGGELAFDPCYLGNPLVNALCVGRAAARRPEAGGRDRPRQPGHPVRLADRPGRDRRRVGAGQRVVRRRRRGRQAAQRAGRRPVHGEAAGRVLPGALPGRARRRHPGPGRGRRRLRHDGAGRGRRHRHAGPAGPGAAARRLARPGRDPDERVAGAHDGDRHAAGRRRVHGHLREVGRAGDGHRRGHRLRPAGDDLARRAGRRHSARQRRRPGPGLRPAGAPAGEPGRARRRRSGPAGAGLRQAPDSAPSCGPTCCCCSAHPRAATRPG